MLDQEQPQFTGRLADGPQAAAEAARLELELRDVRESLGELRAQLLENTSDCVFEVDRQWRFTFLNQRAQIEIASGRELIGKHILAAFPDLASSIFLKRFSSVMSTREARSAEGFFPSMSAWYEVRVTPRRLIGSAHRPARRRRPC